MLEKLKWVGYFILSLLGIAAVVTVVVVLSTLFATLGAIAFGVAIVWFVAFCIKEYMEEKQTSDS